MKPSKRRAAARAAAQREAAAAVAAAAAAVAVAPVPVDPAVEACQTQQADDPEGLAVFTPVPGRARRDGWTPARQRLFLRALAELGSVAKAARAAGMSPRSAHALRARPGAESFAEAWDLTIGCTARLIESVVMNRLIHGELVPMMYRGRQVGERRVFHDRKLLKLYDAMSRERLRLERLER